MPTLILDCDGVMTDGTVPRRFNVRDGHGIVALREAGWRVLVMSRSHSQDIKRRCDELGIEAFLGCKDKLEDAKHWEIDLDVMMGDDVFDLGLMLACKEALCPNGSHKCMEAHIKDGSVTVTEDTGGHGAVRAVCDMLLERGER